MFCISLHWFLSLSLSGARSSHTHRPDFPNFLSVSNILNLAYHRERRPYLHICKPVAARTPEIWSFFRAVKKSKKKHWLSVDWLSHDLEFYPFLKCHRYEKFASALLVQILCDQLYLKFSKNVRLLTKSSWFWKCWLILIIWCAWSLSIYAEFLNILLSQKNWVKNSKTNTNTRKEYWDLKNAHYRLLLPLNKHVLWLNTRLKYLTRRLLYLWVTRCIKQRAK